MRFPIEAGNGTLLINKDIYQYNEQRSLFLTLLYEAYRIRLQETKVLIIREAVSHT